MKYAIGMIIFSNPLYLVGGCISAWVHRKFIEKIKLDIELVVLVDKEIYKYKDELNKYFDIVELIDLIEIKINPEYKIIHKYSKWMKYSISKWQILNQDKYDKILFIDIDILPINDDFYNIFNFDTPAILIRGLNLEPNALARIDIFSNKISFNNDEYYNASVNFKKSLDAGFILFKPDKRLYNEYIDFIKICENKNGYISKYDSGVDETTMLLFLLFYKKIPVHLIPYDYAVTPWDKFPYNKNDIKGINYISMIKPWIKLPMIQWADENIWHKLAKKSLHKHSIITKLYIKYMIDEIYNFYHNYKKNLSKSNSPYNMECIKKRDLSVKTFELFSYLKNHNKEKLSIEQIKKIINMTVEIHKKMDKKLVVEIDKLENIN